MTTDPSNSAKSAPAPEPIDEIDRTTAGDLQRFGITSHPHISYSWNGYRYSNASDAIAAAKEGGTMSRAMNLSLDEAKVREHCRAAGVEVSALETLPEGGVRLVCASTVGAELLRTKLKRKLINGEVRRTPLRADRPMR